jgi:hypothetical protein
VRSSVDKCVTSSVSHETEVNVLTIIKNFPEESFYLEEVAILNVVTKNILWKQKSE